MASGHSSNVFSSNLWPFTSKPINHKWESDKFYRGIAVGDSADLFMATSCGKKVGLLRRMDFCEGFDGEFFGGSGSLCSF